MIGGLVGVVVFGLVFFYVLIIGLVLDVYCFVFYV